MARKPIIDVLNRIRGPFNLSTAALAAAEAAVRDTALHREMPGRQCADARLAGRGAGRDGRAVGHLDREFRAGALCRCAAEAEACDEHLRERGHHRAPGGRLQAAAIACASPSATRRRAAAWPMPIGQFKGAALMARDLRPRRADRAGPDRRRRWRMRCAAAGLAGEITGYARSAETRAIAARDRACATGSATPPPRRSRAPIWWCSACRSA